MYQNISECSNLPNDKVKYLIAVVGTILLLTIDMCDRGRTITCLQIPRFHIQVWYNVIFAARNISFAWTQLVDSIKGKYKLTDVYKEMYEYWNLAIYSWSFKLKSFKLSHLIVFDTIRYCWDIICIFLHRWSFFFDWYITKKAGACYLFTLYNAFKWIELSKQF